MPEDEIRADRISEQARKIRKNQLAHADHQGRLLEFLINRKLAGLYKHDKDKASGYEILKGFYESMQDTLLPESNKGRKLVGSLRENLRDYYIHHSDRLLIQIPEGEEDNYEPELSLRPDEFYRGADFGDIASDFDCLGTNADAIDYLAGEIHKLKRLEDTTVRWDRKESLYTGKPFQGFLDALEKHPGLTFRSITGPVADKAYIDGLSKVLASRTYPAVQCFRLHHATPMMNFAVLHYRANDRIEVLFGYGIQTTYTDVSQTVVFKSANRQLALEFQSLFRVLRNDRFSRPISVSAPDFKNSAVYWCDVLATFPSFPSAEITKRCESATKIIICVTAWHFLERSFYKQIEDALKRDCNVQIAMWNPKSDFIKMRDEAIKGRPGYTVDERKMNGETLELLAINFPNLQVLECDGQASVSLFWIDDLIYFSPYWVGQNASDGTHFLVHATSKTGRRLQRQFHHMAGNPSETLRPIEIEEDD